MSPYPAYLGLTLAELRQRAESALALLESCTACPRDCKINRLRDEKRVCNTGRHALVASHFAHFGEEDCLRGWRGSGTIFFSYCNLRCVFCQNYDVSQGGEGREVTPDQLARMMLTLQAQGCHNVNFVTPEHVVPQVLEALPLAVEGGLRLPLVYNTSAYDALESLRHLDGIVDIYMPDFKFAGREESRVLVKAKDYPERARGAIAEMHRQVGDLVLDDRGLAVRGLLVRHLVMPDGLAGTREVARFLAREISPDTYVNLMDQYYPAGLVSAEKYSQINRRVTQEEYQAAVRIAREEGLHRFDRRWRRMPSLEVLALH